MTLSPLTFKLSTFRVFLPYMVKLGPMWFRKELIDWLPWPDARRVKKVIYKIDSIAQDILKFRRKALEDGSGYGKDILSAMSELAMLVDIVVCITNWNTTVKFNEEAEEDEKIEDMEIISHITFVSILPHCINQTNHRMYLERLCLLVTRPLPVCCPVFYTRCVSGPMLKQNFGRKSLRLAPSVVTSTLTS